LGQNIGDKYVYDCGIPEPRRALFHCCYIGHFVPSVLSHFPPFRREPFGRLIVQKRSSGEKDLLWKDR